MKTHTEEANALSEINMRAEQTSMDLTAARPIEIAEAEEVNVSRHKAGKFTSSGI